jgi:hypothetical protein
MKEVMTRTAIAREISRIELELRILKSQLEPPKKGRKNRSFADLRGIWKGHDFTLEEIKQAEYRLPDELLK